MKNSLHSALFLTTVFFHLLFSGCATPSHSDPLLSAASGLAKMGDDFYVIADDSFDLFKCQEGLKNCKAYSPPFARTLPVEPKQRKKQKPDFESLIAWPSDKKNEISFLAIPSGSKKNRTVGGLYVLRIDSLAPELDSKKSKTVDFASIYKKLDKDIKGFNIEGALVIDGSPKKLRLFHRGNSIQGRPAMIDLDFSMVEKAFATNTSVPESALLSMKYIDLGTEQNPTKKKHSARYGFTDATLVTTDKSSLIVFLTAAEVTDDPVHDGEILGSQMGLMSLDGQILQTKKLPGQIKTEGVAAQWVGVKSAIATKTSVIHAWAVTDADDPNTPAQMINVEIPEVQISK